MNKTKIRTPNDGTTINQKMSNYIQNIKRIFDVHHRFFPCQLSFHFLECWYHLLISSDIMCVCGNGAGEKGAEPKPNANDYFMWQSPDSWILKLAMTERKQPEGSSPYWKAMTWFLMYFHNIVLVHVFVISNDDWRNGDKIKLRFLLSLAPDKKPSHMIWHVMKWQGILASRNWWKAAGGIFPPRAFCPERNFNRKEAEEGERARSQNIKASVRKICFCGFLHSQSFPDGLYCEMRCTITRLFVSFHKISHPKRWIQHECQTDKEWTQK